MLLDRDMTCGMIEVKTDVYSFGRRAAATSARH